MMANIILDQLIYDSGSGALSYKDVRYMLIRPETVIGLQKTIEESSGELARDAFFQGGFRGGYLSAKKYKELHLYDDIEIIEFMMQMGTDIGWGHFKLQNFDPQNKHLDIMVRNSPLAAAYGESSSAVCHLVRGVLSGLASFLFDQNCVGSEVKCLAMGDENCIFEIRAA